MLLGDILHKGVIQTGLKGKDKFAAIDELIGLLVHAGDVPEDLQDHIHEIVMAREASMSTGMENGIALPHASTDRLDDIVGALGIAPEGLPFDSLDGQPAHLVVLVILPQAQFQARLKTLAGIAHLLQAKAFRDMLVNSGTEEEVLSLIANAEGQDSFDAFRAES